MALNCQQSEVGRKPKIWFCHLIPFLSCHCHWQAVGFLVYSSYSCSDVLNLKDLCKNVIPPAKGKYGSTVTPIRNKSVLLPEMDFSRQGKQCYKYSFTCTAREPQRTQIPMCQDVQVRTVRNPVHPCFLERQGRTGGTMKNSISTH